MKHSAALSLKPALILGSGFHRHVFGDTSSGVVRSLFDWQHLVGQVAERMQVAIPDIALSPVQRWETLIIRAAKEGFRSPRFSWVPPRQFQSNVIEKDARRTVAEILAESSRNYPQSTRAKIPEAEWWGSVISLNFDVAWLSESSRLSHRLVRAENLSTKRIDRRERMRLHTCELISGVGGGVHRRVWFPNGACLKPESIRMGLHDYGAAANAIQVAFAHLKQWERHTGVGSKPPGMQLDACAAALMHTSEGAADLSDTILGEDPLPLTWVADFLYRPLYFAGVGLSDQESGLWWLLAQRARNLARTGAQGKDFILVGANDRQSFWRNKPFGLQPVTCSNWDEGWEEFLFRAKKSVAEES